VLGFKVLKSNFAGEAGAAAGKIVRDAAKAGKATDMATKVAGAAALDATDAAEKQSGNGFHLKDLVPFTSTAGDYRNARSDCGGQAR
jgi:hypothetical protein